MGDDVEDGGGSSALGWRRRSGGNVHNRRKAFMGVYVSGIEGDCVMVITWILPFQTLA